MTPESEAQARVDNERARRTAIQAGVSRWVDEKVRMLDPAIHGWTHAERVRRLVVKLGDVGALDPDEWPGATMEGLQTVLTELAADIQLWMEAQLRDLAR